MHGFFIVRVKVAKFVTVDLLALKITVYTVDTAPESVRSAE